MAIRGIKERIVQAAIEEFLKLGYGVVRMQAIATKAGINKALLHYHFKTKQLLYETVLRQQFVRLIDSLFELLESNTDFDVWLQSLIRKYLREILIYPGFTRFILWELSSDTKSLSELFKQLLAEKGHDSSFLLSNIDKKLQAEGYRNYDPLQFLLNVLSLCIYPGLAKPLLEQVLGSGRLSEPDFAAQREREIFRFIKQGISTYKETEQ